MAVMRSVQPYLAPLFDPRAGLKAIGGFVTFGLSVRRSMRRPGSGSPVRSEPSRAGTVPSAVVPGWAWR